MGQGSYYAVGYGVLFGEGSIDQERYESALLASHDRCRAGGRPQDAVRCDRESESRYLAVIVAGGPRGGGPATQALDEIRPTPEAVAEWGRFAAEAGLVKPAQLLWIADYD